jgi:hypothetical protein
MLFTGNYIIILCEFLIWDFLTCEFFFVMYQNLCLYFLVAMFPATS